MKKILSWILDIMKIILGIIWEIIKFIIKVIWKWIVRFNGMLLGMSIFITLLEILDSYAASHFSNYEKHFYRFWVQNNILGTIIYSTMMWVIPITVLIVNWGYTKKCPDCKKWYALKSNGEELIKCEDIQILTEVKRKDNYGHVVGTQEQYVPGTRRTYQKNYICCKCGAASCRTYSRDEKNT